MPAVRSVSLTFPDATHATATLDTRWGLLVLTITVVGTQWTIAITKNGVAAGSTILTSPTIAQLESNAPTLVHTVCTEGGVVQVTFGIHVFTLNPIKFSTIFVNAGLAIPANWWLG